MIEAKADEKEIASRTFADVVTRTAKVFPDERYHPQVLKAKDLNTINGFKVADHYLSGNSDGTGTKPELAERLSSFFEDYRYFEHPAFDALAMVADDVAREGAFVLGIYNSLDVNSAEDEEFIASLARGMEMACKAGKFPLLNGETAELGYRTPGWGKNHLNWNAVAKKIINEKKLITGEKLRAGQPVVALRERSIRSNGLTDARAIIERAYLQKQFGHQDRKRGIAQDTRTRVGRLTEQDIIDVINNLPGNTDHWEQIQLPWHEVFPDLTKQLIRPSTIYAPLMYEAQGGVDGEVNIPVVACAHISGGGVPTKVGRMLKGTNLGMKLDAVFRDPDGVEELIELAQTHGYTKKGKPFDGRMASQTWNRSIGFLCVTETNQHADELVNLATAIGLEAAKAGETTDQPLIEWRGEKWPC